MDELIYSTLKLLANHKARVQEMVIEYRATVDEELDHKGLAGTRGAFA